MIAATRVCTRQRADRLAPALGVAAVGCGLLLVRAALPPGARSGWPLWGIYVSVLGVSALGRPTAHSTVRANSCAVAAIGLTAVALARALQGPGVSASSAASGLALSAFAAVSEEAFFRGFLFARLAGGGAVVAVAVTALLFALVHLQSYGTAVFSIDLAAGLLLSWARWASGRWSVPAVIHVTANLLAAVR